ncbi:MAG: hypothetical protein KAY32_08280 [Candidatus Eisenbacteria sp.]|nr:hypothetical protein [Candidatus Eisenbacteria bacterium]
MDPAGDVHVVYSRLAFEIYYLRRVDGFWYGAELITNNGGYPDDPKIAIDASGSVHVVYSDSRLGESAIYYRRRDENGWSAEVRLPDALAGAYDPAIAVEASGNVHVAWGDLRDTPEILNIYYKRCIDGVWEDDQRLSDRIDTAAQDPAIAVDSHGCVHVVWKDSRLDGGDLYCRRWEPAGWSGEGVISGGASIGCEPGLAADEDGGVHLVWSENTPGDYVIYYSHWNGVGWSLPLQISESPGPARNPDVAVDPTGRVHAVWQDSRGMFNEIYYKQREALPGALEDDDPAMSQAFARHAVWCAPNPCRSETRFVLETAAFPLSGRRGPGSRTATVSPHTAPRLRIFDATGRCVRVLQIRQTTPPEGMLSIPWDGRGHAGQDLPSGAYYYTLEGHGPMHGFPARIVLIR